MIANKHALWRQTVKERARRLRSQCSMQCQGLRSRIEIRINRVPVGLRNKKMGDLLDLYATQESRKPPPVRPVAQTTALLAGKPLVPQKDVASAVRYPVEPQRYHPPPGHLVERHMSPRKRSRYVYKDTVRYGFHLRKVETNRSNVSLL